METRKLKVIYHEDKDILSLIIPPLRPSRAEGDENDFLILRDWDNRDERVGLQELYSHASSLRARGDQRTIGRDSRIVHCASLCSQARSALRKSCMS